MRPSMENEGCDGRLQDPGPETATAAGRFFPALGKPQAASAARTGSPGIPTLGTHLKTAREQR